MPTSRHAPNVAKPIHNFDQVVAAAFVAATMSRPSNPSPPPNAPLAKDVAIDINLPSRENSIDLDGQRLVAIDPHERVHSHHDIVKCRKTGKLYRKVKPACPLAHAKQNTGPAQAHTNLSVGHSFGQRNPGTVGSRPASVRNSHAARTPGFGIASSLAAADVAALVEQLRTVVREEVSVTNRGRAEHLESVINDELDSVEESKKVCGPVNGTRYITSEHSDFSTEDGGKVTMDPPDAEQGVEGDSDADEYEFPNPWAKFRYTYREPFAEFLGCAILMTFGDGINIQALFSSDYDPSSPKGNYLSVSFGKWQWQWQWQH